MSDLDSCIDVGCKVNWTLDVLGRRADGFHELRSWFVRLELGDTLRARALSSAGASTLQLSGEHKLGVPEDDSNLVLRADAAWRQAGGQAAWQDWRLDKKLPPGSGLGAGSADAAAVLQHLQSCAERALSREQLNRVATELGSDIPFFLGSSQAALMTGRGERCVAEAAAPQCVIVVAIPPVQCPTADVFHALKAEPWRESSRSAESSEQPSGRGGEHRQIGEQHQPRLPEQPGRNGLQAAACTAVPALAEWGEALQSVAPFHLSGSGSAWFAVSSDGTVGLAAEDWAPRIVEQVRGLGAACWSTRPKLTT